MVINNQTALLKVVDNRVYFTIEANTVTNANVAVTTFNTTVNSVPVGFVMSVTRQISDADDVLINVRPTISRITGFVNDPNPDLARANALAASLKYRPEKWSRYSKLPAARSPF